MILLRGSHAIKVSSAGSAFDSTGTEPTFIYRRCYVWPPLPPELFPHCFGRPALANAAYVLAIVARPLAVESPVAVLANILLVGPFQVNTGDGQVCSSSSREALDLVTGRTYRRSAMQSKPES